MLGRQLGEPGVHRVAVAHEKRKQLGQLVRRHVSAAVTDERVNALDPSVAAESGQAQRPHRFHAVGQRPRRHRVDAQNLGVLLLPGVVERYGQNGIRMHAMRRVMRVMRVMRRVMRVHKYCMDYYI